MSRVPCLSRVPRAPCVFRVPWLRLRRNTGYVALPYIIQSCRERQLRSGLFLIFSSSWESQMKAPTSSKVCRAVWLVRSSVLCAIITQGGINRTTKIFSVFLLFAFPPPRFFFLFHCIFSRVQIAICASRASPMQGCLMETPSSVCFCLRCPVSLCNDVRCTQRLGHGGCRSGSVSPPNVINLLVSPTLLCSWPFTVSRCCLVVSRSW